MSAKVLAEDPLRPFHLRYLKVPAIALFDIEGRVLCLIRLYLRILSILIRLRYRKVPALALFKIQGIVSYVKVLPKDPKYPYTPEVPQGTSYSLV